MYERMMLEEEVDRLRTENQELKQLVAHLLEQFAAAQQRIAELEQQHADPPPFVKPNRPKSSEPKPKRKKRAPHHNHGRKRMPPTRSVAHALERCPDCAYRLQGHSLDYSREVLELPEPQPIDVIEHRIIKRFCPHCQRWHSPKLDLSGVVLGQGRIGVRIASLIAYLRTSLRLPIRRIQAYLSSLHQLQLSSGEIVELLHQLRQHLQPAIDALKKHARAYSAVTAPTVNSYKRLKVGTTASGATWSPVWISSGYNNRTQMLRIPGPGRIEDRTIDGSCNPYLAAAAVLAAGMDGIESGLDAGEPNSENLYTIPEAELRSRGLESLPANLLEAIGELEGDDVLRDALGRGREEDYVDYFSRVKRDEWFRYHEQVTPWEIREYLTRF
jgi:DNA-binding transcriptional MerR regulator